MFEFVHYFYSLIYVFIVEKLGEYRKIRKNQENKNISTFLVVHFIQWFFFGSSASVASVAVVLLVLLRACTLFLVFARCKGYEITRQR